MWVPAVDARPPITRDERSPPHIPRPVDMGDEAPAELRRTGRVRRRPDPRSHQDQQPDSRPAHHHPPHPRTRQRPGDQPPSRAGAAAPPASTQPAAQTLVDTILSASDEQTVTVPATTATDTVAPASRRQPKNRSSATETSRRNPRSAPTCQGADLHTRHRGVRTAAHVLLEVGNATACPARLPAYAGIAPLTHRSGFNITGEHAPHSPPSQIPPAGLLRPRTRRRHETTPHLSPTPTLRRPVRHVPQQPLPPTPRTETKQCLRPVDEQEGSYPPDHL